MRNLQFYVSVKGPIPRILIAISACKIFRKQDLLRHGNLLGYRQMVACVTSYIKACHRSDDLMWIERSIQ